MEEEEEETRGKLPFVVTEKLRKTTQECSFKGIRPTSIHAGWISVWSPTSLREAEWGGGGGEAISRLGRGSKKKEMARYKIAQIGAKLNRSKSSQNAILYIFSFFWHWRKSCWISYGVGGSARNTSLYQIALLFRPLRGVPWPFSSPPIVAEIRYAKKKHIPPPFVI